MVAIQSGTNSGRVPTSSTNISSGSALKDGTNDGDANSGRVLMSSTNISSGSAIGEQHLRSSAAPTVVAS